MPNIPNTNQPGMYLKSVGDGQNSSHWEPESNGTDIPVADTTSYTVAQVANTWSGTGDINVAEFPNDAKSPVAISTMLVGDSYPRIMLMSSPVFQASPSEQGGLFLGDGTFDPTVNNNPVLSISASATSCYIANPYVGATGGLTLEANDNASGAGSSVELDNNGLVNINALGTGAEIQCYLGSTNVLTLASGSQIGFLAKAPTPVAAQVSGGTLAGVIAGLVALGLFSS